MFGAVSVFMLAPRTGADDNKQSFGQTRVAGCGSPLMVDDYPGYPARLCAASFKSPPTGQVTLGLDRTTELRRNPLNRQVFPKPLRQTLGPAVAAVCAAALMLVLAGTALGASAFKDPRKCSYVGSREACASNYTHDLVNKALKPPAGFTGTWNLYIDCRADAPYLKWTCKFRNNTERGVATVVYNPRTFAPKLRVPQFTCSAGPGKCRHP